MEVAIEYGHEEEQTKKEQNQEQAVPRCSWGSAGRWLVGEGDGRPWRLRVRAVMCDQAEYKGGT